MKTILIILALIISSDVNAQYDLQWYATYDNPHPSYNDDAVDLVEDNLGNIYVTGTSFQITPTDDWRYDFATIKYNSDGDSLWVRRYDSSIGNESEDNAVSIGIDGQNNVYVSGNSYTGHNHATVIKYDANGNQIWVRNYYDSSLTNQILLFDMQVDYNGNVFLLCSYYGISRISEIIKYNTNGDVEWISKYYRGPNDINNLISLTLDNYGNVYATGCTRDSGTTDRDYLTVKYNSAGVLQWTARTNQNSEDIGYCIKADNSGNTYVSGYSKVSQNSHDFKLIKYNSSGEQQWIRSHTGRRDADGFQTYGKNKMLVLEGNENVYVNFIAYDSTNYNDLATAKYDPSGDLKWINVYNMGELPEWDENRDIKIDNTNNIYVTGIRGRYPTSNNSFVILKYDSAGVLKNEIKNNNQFPDVFLPAAMSINNNGDITATGYSLNSDYVTDYFTVKFSNTIGIHSISNSTPEFFRLYQNYPNPFNPETKIKYEITKSGNVTLKIFNVLGKVIATLVNQKQIPGIYEVGFEGSNLSGGVYFYILQSDNFLETKKMIILK